MNSLLFQGPVLDWINAIEAFAELGREIPINIKVIISFISSSVDLRISFLIYTQFVFEGMEESGSENLDSELEKRKDTFLKDVDYICISDNYWLGPNKPCLTYGLR